MIFDILGANFQIAPEEDEINDEEEIEETKEGKIEVYQRSIRAKRPPRRLTYHKF